MLSSWWTCRPSVLTDEALLIGPRVDAILLVVSEGMTERKLVVQALGNSERVHSRRCRRQPVQRQPYGRVLALYGVTRFQISGAPMVSRDAATDPYRLDRDPQPVVVVYTHSLLERSMTFIRSHSEALDRIGRYTPVHIAYKVSSCQRIALSRQTRAEFRERGANTCFVDLA
jgi:hypothetical protein